MALSSREIPLENGSDEDIDSFIAQHAETLWHPSCTARMGQDELSVVDGELCVHGIKGLRIADASVLPRVPTGNTMAPCVIVGEQASAALRRRHWA